MAIPLLTDDLRRFLVSAIHTVPHLEALLLMRDAGAPGVRVWEAAAVAARLYLPETAVDNILGDLSDAGLVAPTSEVPPRFAYAPRTTALDDVVSRLAQVYSAHLIEVTEFIHSKSGRKAQRFADAFRWRKD